MFAIDLLQCYLAGVLKASAIMALADVGAAMDRPVQYYVRFTSNSSEGGVAADRWDTVVELMQTRPVLCSLHDDILPGCTCLPQIM